MCRLTELLEFSGILHKNGKQFYVKSQKCRFHFCYSEAYGINHGFLHIFEICCLLVLQQHP